MMAVCQLPIEETVVGDCIQGIGAHIGGSTGVDYILEDRLATLSFRRSLEENQIHVRVISHDVKAMLIGRSRQLVFSPHQLHPLSLGNHHPFVLGCTDSLFLLSYVDQFINPRDERVESRL